MGAIRAPAIHVSGSGCSVGLGGPSVERCISAAALTTGHGSGAMNMSKIMPKPNVNVIKSRTVIPRSAWTMSSNGPSIRRSTRGCASSGSNRSTGSSRVTRPSRTRAKVAAPVIGLVVDAIRNNESR